MSGSIRMNRWQTHPAHDDLGWVLEQVCDRRFRVRFGKRRVSRNFVLHFRIGPRRSLGAGRGRRSFERLSEHRRRHQVLLVDDAAAPLGSFLDSQGLRNALLGSAQALSVLKIVEDGFQFGINRAQVVRTPRVFQSISLITSKFEFWSVVKALKVRLTTGNLSCKKKIPK